MNTPKNLNGLLMALGVLVVFSVGAFFALGVKSVFTDTASAQLTAPNPGHNYDQIGLPEGTWADLDADQVDNLHAADIAAAAGGGCYTNWNSADCALGWTPVSVGEWTAVTPGGIAPGTLICAAPKPITDPDHNITLDSSTGGSLDPGQHVGSHEPCAICCK